MLDYTWVAGVCIAALLWDLRAKTPNGSSGYRSTEPIICAKGSNRTGHSMQTSRYLRLCKLIGAAHSRQRQQVSHSPGSGDEGLGRG